MRSSVPWIFCEILLRRGGLVTLGLDFFFFFFLARLGGAALLSALTVSRFVMLAAIDGNCLGLLVRFCEMTIPLLKRL